MQAGVGAFVWVCARALARACESVCLRACLFVCLYDRACVRARAQCKAGFYDPAGKPGRECLKCPEGRAHCEGGVHRPVALAGYWADPLGFSFWECKQVGGRVLTYLTGALDGPPGLLTYPRGLKGDGTGPRTSGHA
jgi:hypothetical protein